MIKFLVGICLFVQITEQTTTGCDVQCPPLPGCVKRCLFGHEKDAQGCDICTRCKKQGVVDGDVIIDERNYRMYASSYTPNCEVSARGSLPQGLWEWPKQGNEVRIGYVFSNSVSSSKQNNIRSAITEYDQNTCIRFVPRTQETDYITFVGTGGCSSYIGQVGGEQEVSIGTNCDLKIGTIIHELMHALGFWHEHSRGDRDEYVIINWGNILADREVNFEKRSTQYWDPLNSPYDYGSVLHYGGYFFSIADDKPTIIDRRTNQPIGWQRDGFSAEDIRQVNRKYKCEGYPGHETTAAPSTRVTTTTEAMTTSTETTTSSATMTSPTTMSSSTTTTSSATMTSPTTTSSSTTTTSSATMTSPTTTSSSTTTTSIATGTTTVKPISTAGVISTTHGVHASNITTQPCVDNSTLCGNWTEAYNCNSTIFGSFFRENCRETCGYCTSQGARTTYESFWIILFLTLFHCMILMM
ncbi:uncharacterized protein LOC143457021 [Clavelina lepadiformis]|uniref:Metalloendopeptidase n=1 Tax=Clavelina lepadiformis TaxID=159417 RepID=A0ABP0FWZ2_CLALP